MLTIACTYSKFLNNPVYGPIDTVFQSPDRTFAWGYDTESRIGGWADFGPDLGFGLAPSPSSYGKLKLLVIGKNVYYKYQEPVVDPASTSA